MKTGNRELDERLRKFRRQIKALGVTLDQVREIVPEATMYVSDEFVHIIDGESHDRNDSSRQHAVIAAERLDISGGGW